MPICGSPKLFAAYRVLRRQSVPWHPPCALIRLILPYSHPALLRLLRPDGSSLSIALFSDSSCAVFKVRVKFPWPSGLRNFKTIQKPFQKLLEVSTQILSPTFAGSLPVFLRLCFSLKPFSFRTPSCLPFPSGSPAFVPTWKSESVSALFSP